MDLLEKNQFPDYFNGLSYGDIVGRLARHLPPDLHYDVEVIPLSQGKLHLTFRGCAGGKNGLTAVHYQQRICLQSATATHGDMAIDKGFQQNHAGTFLSYNNLLLRRTLGLRHTFFTAEFMGAYAWARMGALVDVAASDDVRAAKWKRSMVHIQNDMTYLRGRIGLSPVQLDYTQPDCLWQIADMNLSGFIGNNGFFKDSVPIGFEWDADMDVRLLSKAALMRAQYGTDPHTISVGKLILFDRLIPSYFILQNDSPPAVRQWERICNYMRGKGYPDLQP